MEQQDSKQLVALAERCARVVVALTCEQPMTHGERGDLGLGEMS